MIQAGNSPTLAKAPSVLENLMNSDEYKDYIERLASGRKVVTESKPAVDASKLAMRRRN